MREGSFPANPQLYLLRIPAIGSFFMEDYDVVKSDFNDIAELGNEPRWNHNSCYFKALLKYIPEGAGLVLDIGCGMGALSQLAAQRADRVIAVDLADRMIARARVLHDAENIEYICGNVLEMTFENASVDAIVTTATAHHLPYDWLLEFSKSKLKSGGRLIILDIAKVSSLGDYLFWGAAVVPNIIMNLIRNGRLHKDDPHSTEVWQKHGTHDTYMTMREIRQLASENLPGAVVRRKLFWRYMLVWEKQ
jgi:ubiquinone/menaquinone biosynthesis C-methylase UbiE